MSWQQVETAHRNPLDFVRVINRREGGLMEAFVPLSLVYTEDVPVDKTHVRDLADSIQKEERERGINYGQLSPTLLAAVDGFPQFPTLDGFHRTAALHLLGKREVFSTIRPNCTWEDVIDLRILCATTHKAVKFTRLIEWVEAAWRQGPWAERIRVSQAFSLRFAQGLTGVRMGLQPEEVEQIRQWVERKCQQWKLSPGYVYQHLLTAQFADPELVKEARERRSGHKLEAITPLHLSAIAKTLPYNFEMQWVVAEAVKTRMLTVPQTRALAQAVANIQTIDEAIEIIMGRDWKKTAVTRPEPNHEVHLEPRIISEFISDEFTIGLLLIQNALLRGVQLNTSPIDFDDQSPALESFVESLSDLPVLARRINLLHGVFGLPVDDVSRVLNMEISEVANHLGIPPEEQHEGLIEKFAGDASLSDEKVPLPEEHNGSVKTNSYFDDLQTSTVEISPPVPEYAPDRDSHNNGEVPVDLPIEESLAAETVTERSAPYLEPATFNEPDEYEGGMVDIKLAEDETYALLVLLRAPNHRVLLENNGIKYDGTALRKMKRVNDFFLEKKMETGIDLSRYVDETLPRLVQKLREFARGNRRAFMIANQGHAGTLLEFLTNLPSEELESLIGNLYQVYLSAE